MALFGPAAYRRAASRTFAAGTPRDRLRRLRRMARVGDEVLPLLVGLRLAALEGVVVLRESLGDDDVRERIDDRDVRAGPQLQVLGRLDVRRPHEVDRARVDDDQLRALAQAALELRAEHRVAVGRVRADHDDDVRLLHGREGLRAGGLAERVLEAVAGRRMADARAGVDVVGQERRAHQLLDQVGLLVGAARGGDAADRVPAVLLLDAAELARGVLEGLFPAHLAPGIGDALADHRLRHAILVGRVAVGEAALDAGVALVGGAGAVRDHAHDLLFLDLGLQRAADAAVAAGRRDRLLRLRPSRPATSR